jgi:succinate dehydrogenase / fumarate reductase iron-sulfur subunit
LPVSGKPPSGPLTLSLAKGGRHFFDCPKRAADPNFIGPAASVQLYKYFFDPRDNDHAWRSEFAGAPGGVVECESHANCVKVCPKDVRPLRAINFIRKEIGS